MIMNCSQLTKLVLTMAVLGVRVCGHRGCDRPVHVDLKTGIAHDYCGRTHARVALGGQLQEPHGICHLCKLPGCDEQVQYDRDTDRVHDFCCLTHAQEAQARWIVPASNRQRQGQSTPHNRCSLPGCSAPRFVDPTGYAHDFCGRTHAREASMRGLLPASAAATPPAGVDRVWRGRAHEPEYVLSVLTNAHPKYEGIKQQFRQAWEHSTPVPTIMRVLQVRNPASVYRRFVQHASRLGGGGNVQRRFHGTSLSPQCSFGIDVTQPPCTDPGCAVCTICATSFDLRFAGSTGRPGGFFRYGRGLYFSKVCSKSNDYNEASERVDPRSLRAGRYRVMFLCKGPEECPNPRLSGLGPSHTASALCIRMQARSWIHVQRADAWIPSPACGQWPRAQRTAPQRRSSARRRFRTSSVVAPTQSSV